MATTFSFTSEPEENQSTSTMVASSSLSSEIVGDQNTTPKASTSSRVIGIPKTKLKIVWSGNDAINLLVTHSEYQNWSRHMKEYLENENLWKDVIDWSPAGKEYLENENLWKDFMDWSSAGKDFDDDKCYEDWKEKNDRAWTAIRDSCEQCVLDELKLDEKIKSAKYLWQALSVLDELVVCPPAPKSLGEIYSLYNFDRLGYKKCSSDFLISRTPCQNAAGDFKVLKVLWEAIEDGNLDNVKNILRNNRGLAVRMSDNKSLPIHLAAENGKTDIVKFLVKRMSPEDLEIGDRRGYTALHYAAQNGDREMAECLVRKNKDLLIIADADEKELPIVKSSKRLSNKSITLLYNQTPRQVFYPENGPHGSAFLEMCFFHKSYGTALKFVQSCPKMAFWGSSLDELAMAYQSSGKDKCLSRTLIVISEAMKTMEYDQIKYIVERALFGAVANGFKEFVDQFIKVAPKLIDASYRLTDNRVNLIMWAAKHRQGEVFKFLWGRLEYKSLQADWGKNNILHHAAMLPSSSKFDDIPGAALQMQSEIEWFKMVNNLAAPSLKRRRNGDGLTPQELFDKEHATMKAEGEKWMKDAATSSSVVGALIITVMFTAAFTVPGGNNQETGFPIFSHKVLFIVFIISDAISLFASSTSVLMFLGILTSRYAGDDFVKSLPRKLIVGLSTLFLSIGTMMIAFCAAITIMLNGRLAIVIPIILFAVVPITVFVMLQIPLIYQLFKFTYVKSVRHVIGQ